MVVTLSGTVLHYSCRLQADWKLQHTMSTDGPFGMVKWPQIEKVSTGLQPQHHFDILIIKSMPCASCMMALLPQRQLPG